MKNPIEQTNEYLEYLAGRGAAPDLNETDREVLEGTRLLRSMKKEGVPHPKFSDRLRASVVTASPGPKSQSHSVSASFQWGWWGKVALPVLGGAVAAVLLFTLNPFDWTWPGFRQPTPEALAAEITFEPVDGPAYSVAANTSFVLKVKRGTATKSDIEDHLVFSPKTEFAVSADGTNTYRVSPKVPLVPATVYTATFSGVGTKDDGTTEPRNYSWAFQVKNEFTILSTFPRDRATQVSPSTGIEITFSLPGVKIEDFRKHFSIQPKVAGRFEAHSRTLVFIPSKPLARKQVYAVTIDPGIKLPDSDQTLAAGRSFSFEISTPEDYSSSSTRFVAPEYYIGARPKEPVVLSQVGANQYVSGPNSDISGAMTFSVYKYPDLDRFEKDILEHENAGLDWTEFSQGLGAYPVVGLSKVGTYVTASMGGGIVTLGTGFDEGAYLAVLDAKSGGLNVQVPFLVSPYATYSITTSTDSLVWVNNVVSGKPVKGAAISLPDNREVKTDAAGMARFETPKRLASGGKYLSRIMIDGAITLVGLAGRPGSAYPIEGTLNGNVSDDYWSFITTDRELYRPSDTVRVWGFVRPRDKQSKPKNIHLDVIQRSYEGAYRELLAKSMDVTVSEDGTYLAKIEFDGLSTGGGAQLVASVGGTKISEKYLDIRTFRKPPFQVTVTPRQYVAIEGDAVIYDLRATFFDGTPVPEARLTVSNPSSGDSSITTDENGRAVYRTTILPGTSGSFISVYPTDAGGESMATYSNVIGYPAAVNIVVDSSRQGNVGTINGQVTSVDPSQADPFAEDPLSGVLGSAIPGQTIEGKLLAIVMKEVKDGESYDFLAKKVVPQYHFETSEVLKERFTVKTDDRGKFTRQFALEPGRSYRIELATADARKRTTTTSAYISPSQASYGYQTGYALVDESAKEYRNFGVNHEIGDKVTLTVQKNERQTPSAGPDVRFLFMTTQRGLKAAHVQSGPSYKMDFRAEDVPSLSTQAVVFSGEGYFELSGPWLMLKPDSRRLKVTVTPDREAYGTREKVRATIHVEDRQGKPQRARVNVKAIDEAVVSAQGGEGQNPMDSLYRPVESGLFGTFTSNHEIGLSGGAEGGGGGEDRTLFKDAVLFEEVETDSKGNAVVEFTTPDNLTSWRITAWALTDDLELGGSSRLVSVKRPVFAVMAAPEQFLDQDEISVTAAAYGDQLRSSDEVVLVMEVDGDSNTRQQKTSKAFAENVFRLSKLAAGVHNIRLTVTAKGKSDAIVQTVRVEKTYLQQGTTRAAWISRGEKPYFSESGRTILTIADADRSLAFRSAWSLLGHPDGRLDQVLASDIARSVLRDTFRQELSPSQADIRPYAIGNGLALYVVGEKDVEYGALAAGTAAAAEFRGQLISWFQSVVEDRNANTEQVAYALYGLAQLKQAILPEIHALLAIPKLPDQERLTAALALEAIGAKEEARRIADELWQKYGEESTPYASLKLGKSQNDRIVATARYAILAAGLGRDERYGLLEYLQTHPSTQTATVLEQALAVVRMLTVPSAPASVTYALEGKTVTKPLDETHLVTLSLSPEQAKSFSITGFSGNVMAISLLQIPFDPKTVSNDAKLSLTRTYEVKGKSTTTFKRGDVVRVVFSWKKAEDAVGTSYSVTDLLPAGLRVISNPALFSAADSRLNYPYAVEYNRVKLYVYDKSFYYLAQAVSEGTSIAEPPILQSFDAPLSYRYGVTQTVTVRP